MCAPSFRTLWLVIGLLWLTGAGRAEDPAAPRPDDPDLLLWLDAADRETLDLDENGLVARWQNKGTRIGGHVHAAGPQRPRWVADGWQGRPTVRFDGRDDVLHDEQFGRTVREWTLLLIVVPHSNVGSGVRDGYHAFFSANAAGREDFVTGLNVDMGGRETDRLVCINVEGSRGGGENNLLYVGSEFGQPRMLAVWAGPGETTLYAESAQNGTRPASDAVTSLEQVRVGARRFETWGESGFADADVVEVMLYGRALSAAELDELCCYLEHKHGIERGAVERRMSLDEALAALPAIQPDRSRLCLATIDDQMRSGDRAAQRQLETRLVDLLGQPGVSDAAVDAICRRLEIIGTEASVARLGSLLSDPSRSAAARRALQRIPGPEAGRALVAALAGAEPVERVALIQALGARREEQAVDLLLELLQTGEPDVAAAAAAALGNIGAPRSVPALLAATSANPHDLLALAHRLEAAHQAEARMVYLGLASHVDDSVRAAAVGGLLRVDPESAPERLQDALRSDQTRLRGMAAAWLTHDSPEQLAAEVAAELLDLPPPAQSTLLGVRWSRRPAVGRELALQAVQAAAPQVRCDGLRLLADVGAAADTPLIVRLATDDVDPLVRSEAELALRHLCAVGTDAALLEQMASTTGAGCRVAIRAVRERRAPNAEAALQRLCSATDPQTRIEALTALQTLGTPTSVPLLMTCLTAATSDAEQDAAARALAQCCRRGSGAEEPAAALIDAYRHGDVGRRISLLPVIGRLGGPDALEIVHGALADPEPAVRAAGVRGLANWPDATVADQLLQLARQAETPGQRTTALRGFIRVVTVPGVRANDQTVDLLRQAWELTSRQEERKLILERLPAAVCPEALALALQHLTDPELNDAAVYASARLAEALLPQDPPLARDAMRQILDVCQDPAITARLRRHVAPER